MAWGANEGTSAHEIRRGRSTHLAKANLQKNNTNKYYYTEYIFGFLNLQCCFGEAVCTGLFRTDFLHGFLHRFFARIFDTDFLRRFFARFLARFFCADFCAGCLQEWFVQMFARIFARIFLGAPKHLLGSAKISPRKSLGKFTMLWGPSGEGLGRQEGEVRPWPARPGQSPNS